jgi:transcriptional regulator with XRE-family HTH domain
MDAEQNAGDYGSLPAEQLTLDQVVAWNMRHWRRAAGLKQEDLGALIGWSAANVSAAERSAAEHRDRRRFDAQTLAAIARALEVPLAALFLPPEDDGDGKRYLLPPTGRDPDGLAMADLMGCLVMPDTRTGTEVMDMYRERLAGAATIYLNDDWAQQVAAWFREIEDSEARAARAERLRSRRAALLDTASELLELAEALEGGL